MRLDMAPGAAALRREMWFRTYIEGANVKLNRSLYRIIGFVVLCTFLSWNPSAAEVKKEIAKTVPAAPRPSQLIWPPPPDLPRVRWLAEYSDFARIKNPAAAKRGWVDKITGAKAPEEKLMLRKPYGISTDSRSRIYIADTELNTVFLIDPAAKTVERRQGNSQAPIAMPTGLAVDSADRLFVSDARLHAITCFSPSGEILARFGVSSLGRPGGIAIDPRRNRLYVADAKESRIAMFDIRTFAHLGFFGSPSKPKAPEKGTLSGPTNVAVDRQGNIYVADTFNCRVQVFNPDGKFLNAFGTQGSRPGEFIRPKGIAVDSEGHVYVADAEFNNFQVLSPEGQPLLAVGALGSAPGEFALIAGLHIDSHDRIYTTEMFIGRVQVFQYISQPSPDAGKGVVRTSER
jgi:DNA-binding beta-propeller fold protein YncE